MAFFCVGSVQAGDRSRQGVQQARPCLRDEGLVDLPGAVSRRAETKIARTTAVHDGWVSSSVGDSVQAGELGRLDEVPAARADAAGQHPQQHRGAIPPHRPFLCLVRTPHPRVVPLSHLATTAWYASTGTTALWDQWDASPPTLENTGTKCTLVPSNVCNWLSFLPRDAMHPRY